MPLKITTGTYAGDYVIPGVDAPATLGERVAFAKVTGGLEFDEHLEGWTGGRVTARGALAHAFVAVKRKHPGARPVELENLADDEWKFYGDNIEADDEGDGEPDPRSGVDPTGAPLTDEVDGASLTTSVLDGISSPDSPPDSGTRPIKSTD